MTTDIFSSGHRSNPSRGAWRESGSSGLSGSENEINQIDCL
jgi:hypothetical protein